MSEFVKEALKYADKLEQKATELRRLAGFAKGMERAKPLKRQRRHKREKIEKKG